MKIVANRAYGGFGHSVSRELLCRLEEYEDDRTNPELISIVENHRADCGDLEIIEIPDNVTDYIIRDYDGFEEIIYVVEGKIGYE